MKNLRKLLTLVLALTILVSVFALPAMAATTEHDHEHECANEVQPRYAIGPCSLCGTNTNFYGFTTVNGIRYTIGKCPSCGAFSYFPNP